MSSPNPSEWSRDRFRELQILLDRAQDEPHRATVKKLQLALERAKPWLRALIELPEQNAEERKKVENGDLGFAATQENKEHILHLSSILSLSELYSASLVQAAIRARSEYSRPDYEVALFLLHDARRDTIAFLRQLITVAYEPYAPEVVADIALNFIDELQHERAPLGKKRGEGNLADRILVQISDLQEELEKRCNAVGTQQQQQQLPHDMALHIIQRLRLEQAHLSSALYQLANAGALQKKNLLRMVRWLKDRSQLDGVCIMVMTSLFAALEPQYAESDDQPHSALMNDTDLIKVVTSLIMNENWRQAPLCKAVLLRWAFFLLEACHYNRSLSQIGITDDATETHILDSIKAGAFTFLTSVVGSTRRKGGVRFVESAENLDEVAFAASDIPDECADPILAQLRTLIRMVTDRRRTLKVLKQKEEDSTSFRSRQAPPPTQSRDFQALLSLVAALYWALPEDLAGEYWKESAFLRMAVDSRDAKLTPACLDMLAALASGRECALAAFQFLNPTSGISWGYIFSFLTYFNDHLVKIYDPDAAKIAMSQTFSKPPLVDTPISPEDAATAKSLLLVLKNVVQWSQYARAALKQQYSPMPILLQLVNRNVPTELKATLFDVIAVFCQPKGDANDKDIVSATWTELEKITPRQSIGWMARMEEAEITAQSYPASTAFVRLLTVLLPADSETIRPRSMELFTRFVLDDVLLRAESRQYARAVQKWELVEAGLAFVERALAVFDLSSLLQMDTTYGKTTPAATLVASLAQDAGFTVLLRILSDKALLNVILQPIMLGFDTLNSHAAQWPHFENTVLRTLRIVYRVLDIQSLFLEVLLPVYSETVSKQDRRQPIPASVTSFDQLLLFNSSSVIQMALFVGSDNDAISLTAVKVVGALSRSAVFSTNDRFQDEYQFKMNRLMGVLDTSQDSNRILAGFVHRLESDGLEDVDQTREAEVESAILLGQSTDAPVNLVIRSAILTLLLDSTVSSRPGPNIAHYLLGFDLRSRSAEMSLQDPRAMGARRSCLHVIFEQLATGIPRDLAEPQSEPTLLHDHPSYAERACRLIHQLSSHDLTAQATTRYTKTQEAFSIRQLARIPTEVPASLTGPAGQAVYVGREPVETTSSALTSFLRYQSWVLELAALELHLISGTGRAADDLVQILFSSMTSPDDDAEQMPALIIEILVALDVQWIDGLSVPEVHPNFFASVDFDTCLRLDANGCQLYDSKEVGQALDHAKRQLQKQGAISTEALQNDLAAERATILTSISVENHRREVLFTKHQCLTAWRRVLDIVLAKSFDLVPLERREGILFELLEKLLSRLLETNIAAATSELLCGAVLTLMTKLREEQVHAHLFLPENPSTSNLPVERFLGVLQQLLDCLIRPGGSEILHGNLCSVLVNYLQILTPVVQSSSALPHQTGTNDAQSTTGSLSSRLHLRDPLLAGTLSLLSSKAARLLPVICRDAIEGSEVWQTVSFITLDALVAVSHDDKSHQLSNTLKKQGFLSHFVQSIKERDDDVQAVLKEDPENLDALYVFEAKLALLIRLAQSRKGAEDLVDAGLLEVLAQCDFIGMRPSNLDNVMSVDTFLPPTIERYNQLLLPVLQLVAATLSSLDSSQAAISQTSQFLTAHRETIRAHLGDTSVALTSATVEQFALIASIFYFVVPKISYDDLKSPSSFGLYHNHLLTLASRFFVRENWEDKVMPVTDVEREEAQTSVTGTGNRSVFQLKTEARVRELNERLLAYCTLTSAKGVGASIHPVLVAGLQRGRDTTSLVSSAPSVGTAIALLTDYGSELVISLEDYASLSVKLSQVESLDMDEVEEFARQGPQQIVERLSLSQRQLYAAQMLAKITKEKRRSTTVLLYLVEMLLLLIWRHLQYYEAEGSSDPTYLDRRRMLSQAARSLGRILGDLERVELTTNLLGATAQSRHLYLSMLLRRLRDLESTLVVEDGMSDGW